MVTRSLFLLGLTFTTASAQTNTPAPASATGVHAVARGEAALATGEHAVAAGNNATATSYYAKATGWWSTASGGYAIASGFASSASADYAVAAGYASVASNGFAFAPGYFSAATGWYSTAEGDYTAASGHYSRAAGYAGVAGTPGHFAEISGETATPYRTINDGKPEVDLRAYYAPGDQVQLAPAANGYDYVPTPDVAGRARLAELFTVKEVSPLALTFTRAPGPTWPRAFISNLSRGMHQETRGAGTFDNNDRAGDAQASRYVLRGVTLGVTPSHLTANGLEEASDNRIRLKWGQTSAFEIHVVAQRDNGDAACYVRRALITCSSTGATRLVGAVQTLAPDIADEGAARWSVAIEADDEHDALRVKVSGVDGQAVRWVASLSATEVAWFPRR